MTPIKKLLNADLSVGSLEIALKQIEEKLSNIISKLNESIDFQTKLLGANLNRVFTYNFQDFIIYQDGKYVINPLFKAKIEAANIINDNNEIAKHSDVALVLQNFVKKENNLLVPLKKNSPLSNALSVNEANNNPLSLKKGTYQKLLVNDLKTDIKGEVNDYTIINKKFFYDKFYTKSKLAPTLIIKVANANNDTDMKVFDKVYFKDCKFKEIILDYTLSEIEGSGCKLSDFIQTQAPQEPTPDIDNVMVLFMSPMELTLNINGNTYSYTPDMENDTLDVVADSLASAVDIDGVSYELLDGYYSATPQDDDGEYKLGWYVIDTTSDKSYSVQLTSDNNSEHDLEVSYDEQNGKLTVTYASDGSETIYPTISELIDAVNNSDTPFRVAIADESVASPDDDYPYEMEFDLEQTTSLIQFTSNKEALDITTSPTQVFETEKIQDYASGKHQEGYVECETFRRGYKYFIKIDDNEIDVDTTEDNNPEINSANALMQAFADIIENGDYNFEAVAVNNKLTLVSNDYASHTIETSGAIDYQEPLPRTFRVVNDVKNFVRQGDEATLYKKEKILVDFVKRQSPITKADLDNYKNDGVFAQNDKIANLSITEDSFALNDKLPRVVDVARKVNDLISQNKGFFGFGEVKYISKYDLFINSTLNFPNKMQLEKWGILTEYEYTFVPKVQVDFLKEIPLKELQEKVFFLSDTYFTNELETLGSYLSANSIVTYKELLNTPNTTNEYPKRFEVVKPKLSEALNPLFPYINPFNISDKEGYDFISKAEVFLSPEFSDYDKLDILNHPYIKNNPELKRKAAHTLFSLVLTQNSPNILAQLIYLLKNYRFTLDDVRYHLENKTLRDIVLDFSSDDDAIPEMTYGLDGQFTDGTITFSNLYIREYKSAIRKENVSTTAKDYLIADFNNAPLPEKLFICLPASIDYSVSDLTLEKTLKLDDLRVHSIYDDMIYKDILKTAYFPVNGDFFNEKVGSGLTIYGDTIWGLLIRAIHFKDTDTIIDVGDAWSTLKILYSKFTSITDWELALFLSPAVRKINPKDRVIVTEHSALLTLCSKIYTYLKANNVASDDYESTFNKLVGLLFKNDNSATGILPYEIFKAFLSLIGEADYSVDSQNGIFINMRVGFIKTYYNLEELE